MAVSRVATALVVALVCVAAVTAVRADEETTDADEFELVHGESFVASERTDVIAGGVAAEKQHVASEEAGPAAMRFAQVSASAEAAAAHAAAMEVKNDKKRSRWPVSPDHPGKRLGCWITQTHCIRHPNKFVGTFRDVWGEKHVGAGRDEAKCLARAQEYHVYCGNPQVVSTTAKFRNTNRHASYPAAGCWIHQSTCNRDATWTGVFRDAWGEKNLGTGADEARCLKRAREYAVWCGNTQKHSTMAEYRGSGNTRYYPAKKGCFISQDLCVQHPATASPWPFRDLYGEKNVKAGSNEQNCLARAREYHSWCGNPMSAVTKAEFRPTLKRASYPAVDKVQVDAAYSFAKVAWADSERFCKAKGKNLCMRSELCPNGFPVRGRPQGDHWIAVRDMENGWASIGTAFPERVCQLHQEIDGGHYGKPTWGFDQYNHPQLCCDDPDEVVWAKTLALSESITWNEARKACKDDGLKLCPRSAYCPDGAGKPPAGGITEGDHWAPTSDYPNSWVSVGDYDAEKRICSLHDEVTGAAPVWGTQPSTYKFKGHVRCCARDDACRTAPCANGGLCIAGEGDSYKCTCKEGFVGKNCAQENKCAKNPCQNGAECETVGDSGDYRCGCKSGFSGKNCETEDPCSTSPCRNGAECQNTPGAKNPFKCVCKPGFSGRVCGVKNPCTSNPCKNGSRCIRKSDSKFKCKCKAGFTGKHCGVNIDDCTPAAIASCKNGGKCVDGVNTYTCNCDGTKFSGPSCTQYALKGAAHVPGGRGELFIDDDQREDDLGANVVKVHSYGLPGSTVEINAKLKTAEGAEPMPGLIASFKFRGVTYFTGADWECSTDEGKTYRRAVVLEGHELPAHVDANAKYIWSKNLNASPVTCRMHLPMKNLASGTRVVMPVRNRIAPLCSRSNGASVTYYYGEVCANGGVQWNHMHTKGRRSGLSQSQCAWSRKAMKENAAWLANWLGSCTEPPKMLFPKLPSARASFYTKARVEEDPCKASPCGANAACKWTRMGPLPYKCTCAKGYTGDGKKCIEIDNCAENPCSKNAHCRHTGPGKHTCTCKKGFAGSGEKGQCKAINNCNNKVSPCSPRATCTMTGAGTHTCACKPGYKGDGVKCKAINNCRAAKRPCSKHAVCAPTGPGQHRCTCRSGYKGNGIKCKAIDACKKKPCDANATCFKTGPNKYRCECNKGWKGTGKVCKEVNMCKQSKPCHESATCTHKGAGKYSCQCQNNFEGDGKSCAAIDMCARSKPCDANALCTMTGAGKFKCACKEGFRGSGKKCREVNICKKANPCHRNAICTKTGPGVATCKCKRGYSGDGRKCKPINKCKANPCDGNAKCKVTGPGKYKCKCNKGWTGNGKSCQEKNACDDKPCDGHAECTSTGPGTYKCACHEGFKGDGFSCAEINDCDTPGLCNENANCMKTGPGNHKCICKAGFRGDGVHCTEIDACADHPCHQKATCAKTSPGNFKCSCINGFEGDGRTCAPVNACAKKPCGEHATCTSTGPNTYSCSCQRGFRGNGQICNEINSCKERPCPAKSTCLRTGPGRHRCKCAFGHHWSRAAKGCVGINVCKARKGVPAACDANANCESTGPGTAKCACKTGFEGDGKTCKAIDSCKSNPCGRGEQCKSTGPGTFKCSCAAGHRRVKDDAKECAAINKCADAKAAGKTLCGAHGTCNYSAPGKYKCVCNAGFKRVAAAGKTKSGKARSKCVEVKGCDTNPCSAYATCTNKPLGKFECKCMPKFSGDGIKCSVQPGLKAITVGGKVQLVPISKGDKHDDQLSVIEAMLGSLAADGNAPVVPLVAAKRAVKEPNAADRSKIEAVARRINSLEATTQAMAAQASAETQALLNLQKSSKAETERLFKVLTAKTDGAFDVAIDATHAALTHAKHQDGKHAPQQPAAPESKVSN